MTRYAAFLRGINVGKTKRVKIEDIRSMLGRSFGDVRAYGQSGNFVFDSDADKGDIVSTIESGLEENFGFSAFCVVRTISELQKIVDGNPFPDAGTDELFFIFMNEATSSHDDEWEHNEDAAKRINDIVYLNCKSEYHRTKLSNSFFEKELGVVCTARNWNTVNAVLKL